MLQVMMAAVCFTQLSKCATNINLESSLHLAVEHAVLTKTNTDKMDSINSYFQNLYKHFNERKIDLVVAQMTDDVKWANGMEGGYVYGHNGVREYWTRQFTMVSSNVTPLEIDKENGVVQVKVHQVVHDLNGKL